MPVQERLIASVLVPAETRPQQKNQDVLDSGGGGAVLFGIFAFIAVAIALAMRQSNEQRQADIQRMEVRQQQNKAQEAEEAKKDSDCRRLGRIQHQLDKRAQIHSV